VVTLRTIRFNI